MIDALAIYCGMFVTAWVIPRWLWTYRYPSKVSVLLMTIVALIFAGMIGFGGFISSEASLLPAHVAQELTDQQVSSAFQNMMIGLGVSVFLSVLSSVLYAHHLATGGERFGSNIYQESFWVIGYSFSKIRGWLRIGSR